MLTYRAIFHPQSATLTHWQADTLFGHLCWQIRFQDGESRLLEFLSRYKAGQPPVLLSNGFPDGWLPRPLIPVKRTSYSREKRVQVREMQIAKENKNVHWVKEAEFVAMCRNEDVPLAEKNELEMVRPVLKNMIDRLTGTTTPLDEDEDRGNLFTLEEHAFVDRTSHPEDGRGSQAGSVDVVVYFRVTDESEADQLKGVLEGLAQSGYGAKKTAGYGQFKLKHWDRERRFELDLPSANAFISLSNWVPARNDPTEGYYNMMIKYGKLGESWASSDNPFKFPLTMFEAGSIFYTDQPQKEWYGRFVENIAPGAPEVVQYGFAFAVPAIIEENR